MELAMSWCLPCPTLRNTASELALSQKLILRTLLMVHGGKRLDESGSVLVYIYTCCVAYTRTKSIVATDVDT
jgi:hypothetical protein